MFKFALQDTKPAVNSDSAFYHFCVYLTLPFYIIEIASAHTVPKGCSALLIHCFRRAARAHRYDGTDLCTEAQGCDRRRAAGV